jgi:hypothetical protein
MKDIFYLFDPAWFRTVAYDIELIDRKIGEQVVKKGETSTVIRTKLICGCILAERVEFYQSDIKRKTKTLLRRIYNREENQSPFITGKNFITIEADALCKDHYSETIPVAPTKLSYHEALEKSKLRRERLENLKRNINILTNRVYTGEASYKFISGELTNIETVLTDILETK